MFKFVGRFQPIKFDGRKMTKAIRAEVEKVMKEATAEFIEAAIVAIPVFTGLSRGSFLNLVDWVSSQRRVDLDINPEPGAKRYPDKTPEKGANLSFFEFKNEGHHIYVSFSPGEFHYKWNEFAAVEWFPFNPSSNIGPWHSLELGRGAYKDYLRKHLKRRTKDVVQRFITRTEVFGANDDDVLVIGG